MKFKEKIRAIQLRKQGKSYSEILKKISVSRSTISLWLQNIKLTRKQKNILLRGRQKSRYAGAKAQQKKRIEKTKHIIDKAKKEIKKSYKNPLFLSGLMLYWAEGDKSEVAETVKFSNSDPVMIQLMMKWFRKICKVSEKKFRIALHIHTLHCRPHIESYWSKITNIPLKQFNKTYIKPTSLKQRRNPLYNGTCTIRINDKNLFRKIKGWKLGIVKKFKLKKCPCSSMDRAIDF